MISPTPFSDADDSIAEACAWLDGLAQKKPLLSTEVDIEQVQYHLMRASDALRAFGFDSVHIADEDTEAGPMPIMEDRIADPVAAQAYRALETLRLSLVEKAQSNTLAPEDVFALGEFRRNVPGFRERIAGERKYLELLPDDEDCGLRP